MQTPSHLEVQVMPSQCSLVYIDNKSTLSANITKAFDTVRNVNF